jgi:hypothetical protein
LLGRRIKTTSLTNKKEKNRMNANEQKAADAILDKCQKASPENVVGAAHAYNCLMQGVSHRVSAEKASRGTGRKSRRPKLGNQYQPSVGTK